MRNICLLITSFLFYTALHSQQLVWAQNIGSPGHDVGHSLQTDVSGNVYLTGIVSDVADLDPGPGVTSFTPAGLEDFFVARYDADGLYQWGFIIGSTGSDYGNALQLDALGNVYVTGYFENTVDFDPGPGTANLTANGLLDIFIAKYDNSGNYVWAKQIGGAYNDMGQCMQMDAAGNLIFAGYFGGGVDFDAGPGTNSITITGNFVDIFVAKYDNNGNHIYAKNIGGSGNDVVNGLILDNSDNIYMTGTYQSIVDFDPGVGTATLSFNGGLNDVFVAKYDNAMNYVWAKQIGGTGDEAGNALAVDAAGNIYLTGYFTGTVDFDPGTGTANQTATALQDIFICKLDNTGAYQWAYGTGGPLNDAGKCVQVDVSGNVCMAANFTGTVNFNNGTGNSSDTKTDGQMAIAIVKYTSAGNFIRATSIGAISSEARANCMKITGEDNILLTGYFTGYVDFDMTNAFSALSSISNDNAFLAKYNSTPIGIKEFETNPTELKLFPNPCAGQFTLYNTSGSEMLQVEITDLTGKIVFTETVSEEKNTLNVASLPKGIYTIRAFNDRLIFTKKLYIH